MYPVQGMATTEAAIDRSLTRDLYVALGDPQPGGGHALRTYVKPFANWIWGGAMLMALGGVVEPDRPALPRRRARRAGRRRRCRRNDPRRCSWRWRWPLPALAVQPDEILPDPAPGGAGAGDHLRAALRRLPGRVDRRFERRHRPRPAAAGPRAHRRRRQRRRGGRLRRRPLRRVRAVPPAVQRPQRRALAGRSGAPPRWRRPRLRLHPPPGDGTRAAPAAADARGERLG